MRHIGHKTEECLRILNEELSFYYSKMACSLWNILTQENKHWFAQFEKDETEYQTYLSSKELSKQMSLLKQLPDLSFIHQRQLHILQADRLEYLTATERLEEISMIWNHLHALISRHRVVLHEKKYTELEMFSLLQTSTDVEQREALWRSYMDLGSSVQPQLIELVKLRNEIARENGFADFFELKLHSQELSKDFISDTIKQLRSSLDPIYRELKSSLDQELSQSFGIRIADLQPWMYEHPFLPYAKVHKLNQGNNINVEAIKKELINWFEQRNIQFQRVFSAADLSLNQEKSQASFCLNVDRNQDIRLSCHLAATAQSLKILFHELGHAFYESKLGADLPFILKQPHIFISEAIALLFERLPLAFTQGGVKLECYTTDAKDRFMLSMNRLVKLYWFIVVVEFERRLYEDPAQDLNAVWWDVVEDVQLIRRPQHWETTPSWAVIAHLTTLPVYYHNYLLGEILSAQIEATLIEAFDSWFAEDSFHYLSTSLIKPGRSLHWNELLTQFNSRGFSIHDFSEQMTSSLRGIK